MDSDTEEFLLESANWMEDEKLLSKIDEDLDYALALSLQEDINKEASSSSTDKSIINVPEKKSTAKTKGIIDPEWELIDPHPNIQALFLEFNVQYFYNKLCGVEVKWSRNMTLCAGVCSYEGRGGLCSIRLSTPLLKLRPRKDLVETLLHEMIHAYLFVTGNNKDRQDHGPQFQSHMYRINKETGTNITVYHSFHDEVDFYRKHWWKCDGPCQSRKPYYGIVKRAMNRAPSPRDPWWSQHQATCGGTYHKIKEPEDYKQKNVKRKRQPESGTSTSTPGIRGFFSSQPSSSSSSSSIKKTKGDNVSTIHQIFAKEDNTVPVGKDPPIPPLRENNFTIVPFSGQGFTLGSTDKQAPKSFLSNIRKELRDMKKNNGSDASKKVVNNNEGKPLRIGKESTKPSSPSKTIQTSIKNHFTQSPPAPKLEFENSRPPSTFVDDARDNLQNTPALASDFKTVPCPVCLVLCPERDINTHLDECLFLNS